MNWLIVAAIALVLVTILILAKPADSAIPPTRAFSEIIVTMFKRIGT